MSSAPPPQFRPERPTPPAAVVQRLGLYLRELQHLIADGKQTTNSSLLGERLGFSDAQVRKDLAHFGQFGHPGVGYKCVELIAEIRRILGTDRKWSVALIGVGNLGRALLRYRGFESQGFEIAAAFDVDPGKVGRKIEGAEVHPLAELRSRVSQQGIELGILAVPADHAQEAADELVAAGIRGIMNFAPTALAVPAGVRLAGIDLARELEQVAFGVANWRRLHLP